MAYLGYGQPLHLVAMAAMIVFFTYFYTANVSPSRSKTWLKT